MSTLLLTLAAALALSGCTGGPAADGPGVLDIPLYAGEDPSQPGPYAVMAASYDLGAMPVSDPAGKTYPVRLLGEVHFPAEGDGPFPVVLFAHGRHAWCEGSGAVIFDEFGTAHCRGLAPIIDSVASHRGHADVAALLASHGFIAVLPDLNDINAADSRTFIGLGGVGVPPNGDDGLTARNQVLLRLLDELASVERPAADRPTPLPEALAGRVDLERIGLVGHSRGAEAVTHAPAYAASVGHAAASSIRAVFSIAGTPRPWMPAYPELHVPAGVAYASLVPYCDGDVWTLGNLDIHDAQVAAGRAGPLTQFVVMGANHNFYNTEWPQDDAAGRYDEDPYCAPRDAGPGSGRLTPGEQIRFINAYVPAFMRAHVAGEASFLPLFTGAVAVPAFACPTPMPCPDRVHVSFLPEPEKRLMIKAVADASALRQNDLGGATTLDGFSSTRWCAPGDECGAVPAAGAAGRLHLAWNGTARLRTELPAGKVAFPGEAVVVFRIALDAAQDDPTPRVVVVLEDDAGGTYRADVGQISDALFAPPGTIAQRAVLNQVRVPLGTWDRQTASVRAIELVFEAEAASAVLVSELAFLSD